MDPAAAYLFLAQSRGWLCLTVLLSGGEGETFSQGRAGLSLLLLPKTYEMSRLHDHPDRAKSIHFLCGDTGGLNCRMYLRVWLE